MRFKLPIMLLALSAGTVNRDADETNMVRTTIPESKSSAKVVGMVIQGPTGFLDFQNRKGSLFEPLPKLRNPVEESDQFKARRVFKFAEDNFFVWAAPLNFKVSDYLYGLGYGLCGTQSRVLAGLWNRYGVNSRIVAWDRHTITEAEVDGTWCLFDAQHHTDFSRLYGENVGIDQVKEDLNQIPLGLDPVGYSGTYLRKLYAAAVPKFIPHHLQIEIPRIQLADGQELMIRHRPTISNYQLPLLYPPKGEDRSHMIPLYEADLRVVCLPEQPQEIDLGLPLVRIAVEGSDRIWVENQPFDDMTEAVAFIKKTNGLFHLHLSDGGRVRLTYLLANWIGNRIFGGQTSGKERYVVGLSDKRQFRWVVERNSPGAYIKAIGDLDRDANGKCELEYEWCWENLNGKEPIPFVIGLDELSSYFPQEGWQHIERFEWVWNPRDYPSSGAEKHRVAFQLSQPGGRYRESFNRTFLVFLKGPHVSSGKNYLTKNFDLRAGEGAKQ